MRTTFAETREALPIAREALGRYRLRTSLSVLGVVLGVAAVIAMMSVGEGARREALAQVGALGLDNLVARSPGTSAYPGAWKGLTAGDADRTLELLPLATAASPLVVRHLRVAHGGQAVRGVVLGIRPQYQRILGLPLERGRLLSAADEHAGSRTCVLGGALARTLFGFRDPLGERATLGPDACEIVGVLHRQGTAAGPGTTLAWHDLDQAVFVPLPVLTGRTLAIGREQPIDELWVRIADGARAEEAGRLLRHALQAGRPAREFTLVVPRELLAQRYRTQRTFNVVVGSVAALALLVGGIGIMNIMLTSVVERTREIGVRRTVGATRRDVTLQFLTETLLMTLGGGIVGIGVGAAVSWAITAYAGWTTYLSPLSVALGVAVSLLVGLVFGLYPAIKAATLEPVDAMRYE